MTTTAYPYTHLFTGLTPEEFLADCPSSDRELFDREGTDDRDARTMTLTWGDDPWVYRLSDVFVEKWHRVRTDVPPVGEELHRAMISNPHLAVLAIRWRQERKLD